MARISKGGRIFNGVLRMEAAILGATLLMCFAIVGGQEVGTQMANDDDRKLVQSVTPYEKVTTAQWSVRNAHDWELGKTVPPRVPEIILLDGFVNLNRTSDAAVIERLYEGMLDRSGSPLEIGQWVAGTRHRTPTANGKSSEQLLGLDAIARAFVISREALSRHGDENSGEFVTGIYQRLLKRIPSVEEIRHWQTVLHDGAGVAEKATVLMAIATSDEAVAQSMSTDFMVVADYDMANVEHIYKSVLGRLPDKDGMLWWRKAIENGSSPGDVARNFVESKENKSIFNDVDFVRVVYQEWLGREPDEEGAHVYLGLVTQKNGRATMINQIAASEEAVRWWNIQHERDQR